MVGSCLPLRRCAATVGSTADAAVGPLGPAGDAKDDDRALVFDEVDDPKLTDPEAPELAGRELRRAGRMGIDTQGQDRPSEAGRVTGRKSSKLALRGWCDDDAALASGHAPSRP
jgi:hypothetical protein